MLAAPDTEQWLRIRRHLIAEHCHDLHYAAPPGQPPSLLTTS